MPKENKGGIFAPEDSVLIRKALMYYINPTSVPGPSAKEEYQIGNLLHRINSRF